MVAIDNKTSSNSELVGIKSKKSADEVDMLFAELFSLVNISSDEELGIKKNELEFNNNFIKDSNTKNIDISKISSGKTENVAKSLAEIFYKELGIDLTDKFSSLEVKKNSSHNLQLVDQKKNAIFNVSKSITTSGQKNINRDISILNQTEDEAIDQEKTNISISVSNRKLRTSDNKDKILIQNGANKNDLISNQNNKKSEQKESHVKKNESPSQNLINVTGVESERKKINRKKQVSIGDVKPEDNTFEKRKNILLNTKENQPIQRINTLRNNENEINFKIKKNNNDYNVQNKIKHSSTYINSETLDMLESSWGEKFSKMIKNAVSSGLNKVEIMLKPKNLGKLNIDISIKENSTKININAENQESANLLNENLTKINDLIENRNEKLSNSFDNNNNNNFFSDQKRQKKPNHEHTINKKKTIENSTKTSIGNHNIDVQA
jgi:hypothetical protein